MVDGKPHMQVHRKWLTRPRWHPYPSPAAEFDDFHPWGQPARFRSVEIRSKARHDGRMAALANA